MHILRANWPFILFACLVAGFGFALFKGDLRTLDSKLINQPFPDFNLSTLEDSAANITEADLKGRISLVNVFGSWCVACVQEHPNLMQIGQNGRVRLVGMNWRDERAKARSWLDKYDDPYDLIIFDADSQLAIDLGVTGAPETFLVDASGHIRYKHVGIITAEVWFETLLPMIEQLERTTDG